MNFAAWHKEWASFEPGESPSFTDIVDSSTAAVARDCLPRTDYECGIAETGYTLDELRCELFEIEHVIVCFQKVRKQLQI